MFKKIIKAIRRAKSAAYLQKLKKQLARLEARLAAAEGDDRFELQSRVNRKLSAIGRASKHLATLGLALALVSSAGCAHGLTPTDAIETAVIVTESALDVCRAKLSSGKGDTSQAAQDAREGCLLVQDIDRTRDATTALDDAVEAVEIWIKTGA